ncbi:hypothetical protein SLS60_009168 [Paraconiothyrium brasiliense]|uniref:SH2 domain-containing protein n=1 Tax=Paraconiothyrium brasiliense TaxID=300254 RepID=A0ABR3QWJ0_9PLEO
MSSISTPIYPDPDPVAEAFLEPVKVQLKKLRLSTASAAPPPNMSTHFRIKSHLQLVRERLEPVGSFIVREAKEDGKLEMRVCHYIAKHHWPLPTPPGEATHLRIHEMYRNTLYKRAQLALHPPLAVQYKARPSMLPPPPESHDDEEDWPDAMPALEPSTSLGKSVKNKFTNLSRKVTSTFHKSSMSILLSPLE